LALFTVQMPKSEHVHPLQEFQVDDTICKDYNKDIMDVDWDWNKTSQHKQKSETKDAVVTC